MQNYRNGKWANQIISMQQADGTWDMGAAANARNTRAKVFWITKQSM